MHTIMNKIWSLVITALGLICTSQLECRELPFYLNWDSSNSYTFYEIQDDYTGKLRDNYKIHFGIDTLMANDIRVRLDLTNQEMRQFSQVVINHAMIDYHYKQIGLQLSMQDFGYGKGFWLYNRRSDDALYNKNSLLDYRWHGISSTLNLAEHQLGIGFSGSSINRTIAESNYRLQNDYLNLKAFAVIINKHSQYNTVVYHGGTELSLSNEWIGLHSGVAYQSLPKSHFFPAMDSWHLINELDLEITNALKIIMSADLQTTPEDKKPDHIYEICLGFSHDKLQSYAGASEKTVFNQKAYTYFAEFRWQFQSNLTIGLFYDYVNMTENDNYSKVGLQTQFRWK
jgi:hypothetical protein